MLQEISRQLSGQIMSSKDGLVKTAICNVLGHDEWAIADLKGRLRSEKTIHDDMEVFYLDGQKLIAFYPVEFGQEEVDGVFTITARWKYKVF